MNTVLVELSEEAQNDLRAIKNYIAVEGHTPNPAKAQETVEKILNAIKILEFYPSFGRAGRVPDTLELLISTVPYFVVYRFVDAEKIVVTTIFHESRRYPQRRSV